MTLWPRVSRRASRVAMLPGRPGRPVRRPRVAQRIPIALFALLVAGTTPGSTAFSGHTHLAAQSRTRVLAEPGSTAVGLAVQINAGSGWEAGGEAGMTLLAGLAILEEIRPQLDALGALTAVECDRNAITVTALLPRASWRAGADLVLDAFFHPTPGEAAVERARESLIRMLAMEEGNPAHELRHALQQAHFGRTSRWARAGCGRQSTLREADHRSVVRMARLRFVPSRAAAAIAGPIDTATAGRLLRDVIADTDLPLLLPSAPGPASARRVRQTRNTVTTFLGLAYPVRDADALDDEALRMLAFLIRDAAEPGPQHPDIYDVETAIERHGDGAALAIYMVTDPATSSRWIDRVNERIRATAAEPLTETAFADLLRRYRGARLLALSSPEARAREAARQLFYEGRYHAPDERLDDLSPERLRRAARALGRPSIALIEPD